MKKDDKYDQNEEQTYNIEGIKDFLRKPHESVVIEDSDVEDSLTEEHEIVEKSKKKSRIAREEEDYEYDQDPGEEEDEGYGDDLLKEEEPKLLKNKRNRSKEKNKSKKKSQKNKVREFLEDEAESDDEEESEGVGEITKQQQEKLFKEQMDRRDKRYPSSNRKLGWIDKYSNI
jgi:hypothetical protein